MSCGVVSRVVGRRLSLNRPQSVPSIRRESDAASASPPARLNTKVRVEEAIVRDTVDSSEIAPGKRVAYCRCWQSNKFPFCDGAHKAYNQSTGDNLGPLILSVPKNG